MRSVLLSFSQIICIILSKYIINDSENSQRTPSMSNKIGVIDILDDIDIEFDITINSFNSASSQYSSILQFGNTQNEKYPAIYIDEWSELIRIEFNSISNMNQFWESNTLNANVKYHIQFTATQTSVQFIINGITSFSESITSHSILFDRDIFIGNSWNNPSDCILTSLTVTTSNSNNPKFNYLCDYNNRFTSYSGTWSFDPNTCFLRQTDYNN
eukprot:513261_1